MQRNRSPLWWRTNHVQACIVSSFASMPDYSWCRRTLSCSARRSVHAVVCHRDSSQCKFNFGQPGKHKSHVVFANTSARRVNIVATCVLLRGWIASVLDVYYFNVLRRKEKIWRRTTAAILQTLSRLSIIQSNCIFQENVEMADRTNVRLFNRLCEPKFWRNFTLRSQLKRLNLRQKLTFALP